MDELLRALARKYQREPSPENASLYIRALEQAHGGQSDPSILLEIWVSCIMGLFDRHGVNYAVYHAILTFTELLFGGDPTSTLRDAITAADGGYFISVPQNEEDYDEENSWSPEEVWLDSFFQKIKFTCATSDAHPSDCSKPHRKCQAMATPTKRCQCPGCYTIRDSDELSKAVCLHHYLIRSSESRTTFYPKFPLPRSIRGLFPKRNPESSHDQPNFNYYAVSWSPIKIIRGFETLEEASAFQGTRNSYNRVCIATRQDLNSSNSLLKLSNNQDWAVEPNPSGDPLKDPNDNTGTLILLSIWGIRNGKKYCWWEDIVKMLDYVPIDHLRRVIRRLQDCGFIDSGPDGYTLYPAGFHVVKEALKGLPPPPTPPKIQRRNPDEDIRDLERNFRATRDRLTALRLFNAYQRAGIKLADQGRELEFLVGYTILEPFITAYVEAYRDDGTIILMRNKLPGHQLVLTPRVKETKEQLIAQSVLIGYPPSYFCYRPYHHIPYVNTHMEELAILHNAVIVDAWRDDDSYQGEAVFEEITDAKAFIDAVVHQDLFQRESFRLRGSGAHPPAFGSELSIVTWEQGK